MKGLALAELFFNEVGAPTMQDVMGDLYDRLAFGLVGEGSECLGYDDEFSRDHDWGPGFCIWMTGPDYATYGKLVTEVYDGLPKNYGGYTRIETAQAAGRAMAIIRP